MKIRVLALLVLLLASAMFTSAAFAQAKEKIVITAVEVHGAEPGTPGQFKVSHLFPGFPNAVEVTFSVGGDATPGASAGGGSDYLDLGTTVTILGGETEVLVDVTVFDDALVEGTEEIVVTLISANNNFEPVPDDPDLPDDATINILDDDVYLTLNKSVDNSGGLGTAVSSEWNLSASGPTPVTNVKSGTQSVVTTGSYVLSEADGPAGYTNEGWVCDQGLVDSTVTVDPLLGPYVCTVTNSFDTGSLTLVKEVSEGAPNAASEWTLTATNAGDVVVLDGTTPVSDTIAAGVYTLGETGPAGYTAAWLCDDDGATTDGTIDLGDGDTVTCTVTNTYVPPTGTLTLVKEVSEGAPNAASEWTLTATNAGDEVVLDGTTPVSDTIATGLYTLDETGPAGYTAAWLCDDDGATSDGTIDLGADETITCTVTNTFIETTGTLTLVKEVSEGAPNAASEWTLTATDAGDQVVLDGTTPVSDTIATGVYTLDETGPAGYTAAWLCDDDGATSDGTIDLGEDETITCTVTNTFIETSGTLTLVKEVSEGAPNAASEWTLTATDAGDVVVLDGTTPVSDTIATGLYTLGETGPGGYSAAWLCDDDGATSDGTIDLGEDETITCTVTNTFIETTGTLTLVKEVSEGAPNAASEWTLTATDAGDVVVLDGTTPVSDTIATGLYTLGETGPGGYSAAWLCDDDGATSDGTIDLGEDETITCTVTNTFIETTGTLTLVKEVSEGAPNAASEWTLTATDAGDVVVLDGTTPVSDTIATGVYTLGETGPGGYSAAWLCDDDGATSDGTIDLGEDETITCTVTNTFIETSGTLTLVKEVSEGAPNAASEWTLTATNAGDEVVLDGTTPVSDTIATGLYTLGETGPGGYSAAWLCDDDGATSDGTIDLGADETITCTVTNTYIPLTGTLTLEKVVENDQGGPAEVSDFTLTATGPDTITGKTGDDEITGADVAIGEYELTESVVPGYSLAGWECTSGLVGTTVTVGEGDEISCTVTNTDDAPVATIIASMPDAAEPDIDGEFEVQLSPAPEEGDTVTVTYEVLVESTAIPGTDYVALTGTVDVDDTGFGYIDVVVIDDLVIEDTKTVVVALTNVDDPAYVLEDPNLSATVNIEDNDGGGIFSIDDLTIAELDRTGFVRVDRRGGSKGNATVDYDSADGTATAPADYEAISGTLDWAPGETTKWIELTVRHDNVVEGDEFFTVTLSNALNEDEFLVDIDKGVGVITITDPIPIPTLSTWAMMLMALMLGLLGVFRIPARQREVKK